MKEKNVLLLSGGRISGEVLKLWLKEHSYQIIIAIDHGLQTASELNLPINYLVGDFDSVEPEMLKKYEKIAAEKKTPQIIRYLSEKDDTDTEIALRLAIQLHATQIDLWGATGTRMDHTNANISMLLLALQAGIPARIMDEWNRIYLKNESFSLKKQESYGKFLSFMPFENKVTKLTLRGLKYSLTDYELKQGSSVCISNEFAKEEALISFHEGILVVYEARD